MSNYSDGAKQKKTYPDGRVYEGDLVNDEPHGQGSMTWANRDNYTGQWAYGKEHGQGTYTWFDSDKYEGEWRDGKRTGQGTYTWSYGRKLTGEWRDGVHVDVLKASKAFRSEKRSYYEKFKHKRAFNRKHKKHKKYRLKETDRKLASVERRFRAIWRNAGGHKDKSSTFTIDHNYEKGFYGLPQVFNDARRGLFMGTQGTHLILKHLGDEWDKGNIIADVFTEKGNGKLYAYSYLQIFRSAQYVGRYVIPHNLNPDATADMAVSEDEAVAFLEKQFWRPFY